MDRIRRRRPPSLIKTRVEFSWRPLVEFYYAYAMPFYLFMLAKNLLFILPRYKPFESLIWLDCFVPGRLVVGSRIPQASQYLSLIGWLYMIANKLLLDQLGAHFVLFCLEFAAHQHRRFSHLFGQLLRGCQLSDSLNTYRAPHKVMELPEKVPSAVGETFQSRLDPIRLVRRPLRTARRQLVHGLAHWISLIYTFGGLLFMILFNGRLIAPVLTTRRGFELTRDNCVKFILATGKEASNELASGEPATGLFDLIYKPQVGATLEQIFSHRPAPLRLPYVNMVQFNGYHVARVFFDTLENLLTCASMALNLWFSLYFVIALSWDALIYAAYLSGRLADMADKLRAQQSIERAGRRGAQLISSRGSILAQAHKPQQQQQQQQQQQPQQPQQLQLHSTTFLELRQLQGSICDYFAMIAYYNSFVSISALINILLWLIYTFLVFVRTLRVARLERVSSLDHGVLFEFFALFACTTFVAILMLITTSQLHARAAKLYNPIIRLMLLDRDVGLGRKRWIGLLRYFEPKKQHCFTFFGHTALSWLFCLELVFWVISAFVILMSL